MTIQPYGRPATACLAEGEKGSWKFDGLGKEISLLSVTPNIDVAMKLCVGKTVIQKLDDNNLLMMLQSSWKSYGQSQSISTSCCCTL